MTGQVPRAISDLFFNYEKDRAVHPASRERKAGQPVYDDDALLEIAGEFLDTLSNVCPDLALPSRLQLVGDFYDRM